MFLPLHLLEKYGVEKHRQKVKRQNNGNSIKEKAKEARFCLETGSWGENLRKETIIQLE